MSEEKSDKGTVSKRRPQDWSPEDRLRAVLEASSLSDEELGAFLRRNGLHEAQLAEWREAVFSALSSSTAKRASKGEAKRIRELEREIKRKDKALAETAALLVLQKKVRAIWGDGDDDTEPKNGK
jgi:transposase-like protein